MGEYWRDDDSPSELGLLFAAAKDRRDGEALSTLCGTFAEFARTLDWAPTLVVAVPPGPRREAHPVPALAGAVAASIGVPVAAAGRRHDTPRLRDTPVADRPRMVDAAGYHVTGDVTAQRVLLVDDVILTGTTVRHLAALLRAAGASEVQGVVVCRTRRRGDAG